MSDFFLNMCSNKGWWPFFVQYEADWKMNENVILRTSLIEVWIQWVPHCLEKMVKFKRAPGHSPLRYQLSYYSNINYLISPISIILIDEEQTSKRSLPVTIQTTIQYQSKVQASQIYQSLFMQILINLLGNLLQTYYSAEKNNFLRKGLIFSIDINYCSDPPQKYLSPLDIRLKFYRVVNYLFIRGVGIAGRLAQTNHLLSHTACHWSVFMA